jgi:hypothetical protein
MKERQEKRPKMVSRYDFDKLFPDRAALERFTGRQVEWFVNDAKNICGAIDRERMERAWSYVVLKRNERGLLQVLELKEQMKTEADAERELFRKMEAAETT